jgi:hypothetical protein
MASLRPRRRPANPAEQSSSSAGRPIRSEPVRSQPVRSQPAQSQHLDWVRAARRLHQVRLASQQFLFLWMLQGQGSAAAARTDIPIPAADEAQLPPAQLPPGVDLPPHTGWSALYVGDVLDD